MRTIIFLILSCFVINIATGQIKTPVKWSFDKKQVSDNEYDLIFKAKIDDGWHVYSQFLESDEGPVATSFNFEDIKGYEVVGKTKEDGELTTKFSSLFGMNLAYFDNHATFTQRVKVAGSSAKATGYLEFMTCDDVQCLPPTPIDFTFDLAAGGSPKPKAAPKPTVETKPTPTTTIKPPTTPEPEKKPINGSLFPGKKDGGTTSIQAPPPVKTVPVPVPAPPKEQPVVKTPKPFKKAKEIKETVVKNSQKKPTLGKGKPPTQVAEEDNKAIAQADIPPTNILKNLGGNTSTEIFAPVKWIFNSKKISDTEFDLVLTAKIDDGWYVYSQVIEGEGPIPTSFEIEDPKGIELVGKAKERGKEKSGFDPVFGIDLKKFSQNMTLIQRLKVPAGTETVNGFVTYMTCNNERCLPPTDVDFSLTLGEDNAIADAGGDKVGVTGGSGKFGEPVNDCGNKKDFSNLWLIFLLGFGGGLIALLTPCVFPMIPLTVGFFTKQSDNKAAGIKNALIYGLSIIVIYVSLGMVLTLIFGPQVMNDISTNGFVNMLFFVLFVVFAFSFFGFFEIRLPSSWANKTDALAGKGGLLGIFFMAFTLGIVSFSCTGPIIGTLLVEAAKSTASIDGGISWGPPIGMLGFATALALPFTLFAAFPGWLNSLPKSGGWMNTVKVVLGFLELMLALKFLSIVDLAYHWNFLKFELFMGLWAILALGLTLYLFGIIRFPHDGPRKKLGLARLATAIGSLVLTGAFTYSLLTYTPLYVTSGLAPAVHYNFFRPVKCPHNLDCFKDYEEGLAYAKKHKKPMLIDFTGYGCVNCRKMEEFVWPKPEIMKRLREDFVVVSLYVDDKTKLDQKYTSKFDGKTKRTVGNKWADFQATHFNANSQPYYVLASHEERLLSLPKEYTPDAAEFANFLDCGLNSFYDVCPECKLGNGVGMNNK